MVSFIKWSSVRLSICLSHPLVAAGGFAAKVGRGQILMYSSAFSALTLLIRRQEGHAACKNRVVGCWRGYLSGVRCRLAYGPADATATHCLLLQ